VSQETFVNYKHYRWLWVTLIALVVCLGVYVIDSPPGGRNGGTVVGYTFGTIATLGIVWLMAYGLRKRAYRSSLGTLVGWLAAHVWIGIGLLLLVPLHAAFSFGVNVHTLAYVLMVLTIVSGVWGVANYSVLSGKITAHRGESKDVALVEQLDALTAQIEKLCVHKSESFLAIANKFDFTFKPSLFALFRSPHIPVVDQVAVSLLMQSIGEGERDDAISMLGALDQRSDLARRLLEQSRIKALLKVWLYVHVPVSVGLCVALAIHIVSVFYFW